MEPTYPGLRDIRLGTLDSAQEEINKNELMEKIKNETIEYITKIDFSIYDHQTLQVDSTLPGIGGITISEIYNNGEPNPCMTRIPCGFCEEAKFERMRKSSEVSSL